MNDHLKIAVVCHTNLDEHNQREWPKFVCSKPVIGEKMESKDGFSLRIVNITFQFNGSLKIELYK